MKGRLAATLLMALLAAGCVPEEGPAMDPGQNCLRCHGGVPAGSGKSHSDARAWSFAGTVYTSFSAAATEGIQGATVTVTDATGRTLSVRSNAVGNFYTAETMTPPLQGICVECNGVSRCMPGTAPHGACNFCHAVPPVQGAPGRVVCGNAPLP